MNQPKKILVIKARSLGDTILMTASLDVLKKAFPKAEIHVAVTHLWADLLAHSPVQKVWRYEHHAQVPARAKALTRLALHLRKQKFDWVINFHSSPALAALAYAVGAKTRAIHFHGAKQRNLYSTVSIPGKGEARTALQKDFDVLRALGLVVPSDTLPKLQAPEGLKQKVRHFYESLDLRGPRLIIGLGASRPSKIWPLKNFATVALRWVTETDGHVAAVFSKSEQFLYNEYREHVEAQALSWFQDPQVRKEKLARMIPECERPLPELNALLETSSIFCGNDSGPKHLAVASQIPTLTLFGPEDPFEWHPYSRERHPFLYVENLSCRVPHEPHGRPWCGLNECFIEEHRCMKQISEGDVSRALFKLWKESGKVDV